MNFASFNLKIEDILAKLTSLEELTCDADLEGYILAERDNKNFLQKLKLLNEIPLSEKDSKKRQW